MARQFEDNPAVRQSVPLHIGLVGPSGSGKTYSALRLATGIQSVYGGDIFHIDTEANRALHYADKFKFRHVPFAAPFDPLSYLAAVEHCVSKGAKTIIIDSASHLHEGQGGTLEAHEAECDRLVNQWRTTRDKVQMAAWAKPKTELRQFINTVLQMNVNVIWCFRAKEKIKLIGGKTPQAQGFMPISSDELIYEMSCNMLLYPNSGGVPTWQTEEMGEKAIIKLPVQFQGIFRDSKPLDESIGKQLAKWAYGNDLPKQEKELPTSQPNVDSISDLDRKKIAIQQLIIANEELIPDAWKTTANARINAHDASMDSLNKTYDAIDKLVKENKK